MQFIHDNWLAIAALLLAIDKVIMLIPGIKSNNILQALSAILTALGGQPPASPPVQGSSSAPAPKA